MAKSKCTCGPANFLWMVIAVIVMGVGLWFLVGGIRAQWADAGTWQMILVWYALGFLLIGMGKMFKHKSCGNCSMHSMK
ncbi:hypothetical protein HY492_00375 [Candidatus Woesearchaeota archaeon]|nr:hypothetical protein [Candidatus Woesearchaeota archaeon]